MGIGPLSPWPMENYTMTTIDIHQYHKALQHELRRLTLDESIRPEHRKTIMRFIADARDGRTVRRGARKQISDGRCLKMIYHLRRFAMEVSRPFHDLEAHDVQRFIFGLEDGTIGKLRASGTGTSYSAETVLDYKKILKKFFKWLHGEGNRRYHDLTDWIDTRDPGSDPEALTLEQVQHMAECLLPQGTALFLGWFDGGYRPGELFNVCLRDVRVAPDSEGRATVFTTIRVSKTKPRTISLPLATDAIMKWLRYHPNVEGVDADGRIRTHVPDSPLFTWTYDYTRKVMHRTGKAILEARLYPYRFRHSSATYYARYLSRYQLCARYGWTMSSNAPDRYIDRSGVLAEDTASVIREVQRKQTAAPSTSSLPPPDRWAA